MKPPLPKNLRRLRADMELKALDLYRVAAASGVPYTECSRILNGRVERPADLKKIASAIKSAPEPKAA